MAMTDIENKLVVLTGNGEVGYGAENAVILGRVVGIAASGDTTTYAIGYEGIKDSATYTLAATTVAALGLTGDYLVSVEKSVMVEDVAMSSTSSKKATFGDYVLADGSGGIVKVPTPSSGEYPVQATARCISADATANTATILIM